MAKRYDICALCGSRALLNYAMLCKRCNKAKESVKIKKEIFAHDAELIEEAKEAEAAAEVAAAEGGEAAEGDAPAEGGDAPKGEAKPEEKS